MFRSIQKCLILDKPHWTKKVWLELLQRLIKFGMDRFFASPIIFMKKKAYAQRKLLAQGNHTVVPNWKCTVRSTIEKNKSHFFTN
jgi:hypothetical protein